MRIDLCESCGLIFSNPRFTPEEIEAKYRAVGELKTAKERAGIMPSGKSRERARRVHSMTRLSGRRDPTPGKCLITAPQGLIWCRSPKRTASTSWTTSVVPSIRKVWSTWAKIFTSLSAGMDLSNTHLSRPGARDQAVRDVIRALAASLRRRACLHRGSPGRFPGMEVS